MMPQAGMGYTGKMESNYKGKKPYVYDGTAKDVRKFDESAGKSKMTFKDGPGDRLNMRPGKSSSEYNKAREEVGSTRGEQVQLQRKNNVVNDLPNNPGGPVKPMKLDKNTRQAAMGRMLGR